MNEDIKKAIRETLIFFDIFNRPLTAVEIWQFLNIKCELGQVIEALDMGVEKVEMKNGFFYIAGREDLVNNIYEENELIREKYNRALRSARLLRLILGVKMVAICNNFFYKKESDIDLFIITKAKRLWLTRFLVTSVLHIFKLRRHGKQVANRICLSFYISEEKLNIEEIALTPSDPYLCHWLTLMFPIYGQDCYVKFYKANSWVKKYLPNAEIIIPGYQRLIKNNFFATFFKYVFFFWTLGFFGNFVEIFFKKIQLAKIKRHKESALYKNNLSVIVSDYILKFHENDRRQHFAKLYQEKLREKQI